VLACALFASFSLACQSLAASAIVNAPNRGAPAPRTTVDSEIRIPVGPPNAVLSLEVLAPEVTRATVFVLHGIRADKDSTRGWGALLVKAGFRAVLVDLRGHGRSTGDFLTFGVIESRDLAQLLDALEARGLTVGDVGVLGFSYGGGVAIEWAGIDPRVKAVVAVASFASLRDVVPDYVPMLSRSFVNGAVDLAGRRGGFDPDDASPVRAMGRTAAPILLIHGLDDHHVPWSHSQHLFDARREHTQLLLIPGANHASIATDPAVTENAPAWFARYLTTDVRSAPFVAPHATVPR
jgi:pimeloyl-ACP methyl ester carboxylesterase